MAYSMDYRSAAVSYKEEGHTFKQLREAFKIPPETYYEWKGRLENGYYETITRQERSGKIDKEQLKQAVAEHPDAYLRELAEPFGCTPQAVHLMLQNMNITLKKRHLPTAKNPRGNARSLARY
jgi:transposase